VNAKGTRDWLRTVTMTSETHRSPFLKSVTFFPTLATTPTASCPGISCDSWVTSIVSVDINHELEGVARLVMLMGKWKKWVKGSLAF
jgi:hypothetical protein